jgi:hypothetical protein
MMAELHRPVIDVGVDRRPAVRAENLHYALGWFTADGTRRLGGPDWMPITLKTGSLFNADSRSSVCAGDLQRGDR